MISKIIAKNLQRHKNITINLTSGFNCILGENNRGKSSIIRGLHWLFTNSPRGDWMCRKDKKGNIFTCTVKIIKDNGTVIKRVKGKTVNKYVLNGEEFNDIGHTVPIEILEALNLDGTLFNAIKSTPYVNLDDDTSLFLVYAKSTEIAQAINIITGVDIAEKAIKSFNKDRLRINKEVKFNENRKQELQLQLEDYNILDELPLTKIYSRVNNIKTASKHLEGINKIISDIAVCDKVVEEYEMCAKIYKNLIEAEKLCDEVDYVQKILDKVKLINENIKSLKNILKVDVDFSEIDKLYDSIQTNSRKLNLALNAVVQYKDVVCTTKVSKKLLEQLTGQLKQYTGKRCPWCNNKIKGLI